MYFIAVVIFNKLLLFICSTNHWCWLCVRYYTPIHLNCTLDLSSPLWHHSIRQHNIIHPISISGKTFVVKKSYRLRRAIPCYAVAIIPHHITRTVSIPPLFLSVYFFFVSLLYSPPTFLNRHFVSFALASISIAQTHENNSLKSQTAIENESAKEWC